MFSLPTVQAKTYSFNRQHLRTWCLATSSLSAELRVLPPWCRHGRMGKVDCRIWKVPPLEGGQEERRALREEAGDHAILSILCYARHTPDHYDSEGARHKHDVFLEPLPPCRLIEGKAESPLDVVASYHPPQRPSLRSAFQDGTLPSEGLYPCTSSHPHNCSAIRNSGMKSRGGARD